MNITLVDKIVLLCAKRNSGKSVLLNYLVNKEKDKFDKIFIISPTEKINK
jgi:polynucleotide 5'-kinase involved in rRNA processing